MDPRLRKAFGLAGVGLVLLAAIASPWLAQPGYGIATGAVLAIAGTLLLVALFSPAADSGAQARVAGETPIEHETSFGDSGLREQIASLRQAQDELVTAKRRSEAAVLAKDEFLATMSHEIRTPLNGVLPLLDLVLSTPLSAEQREYIETAQTSAQQMLRIVDDILDYSRLDVGKLELDNVGLNLRELVDGVVQLMRRSAEAKGLRLTMNIDPNVRLAVRGDPLRLRQILMNLVSNAIKFTERGGVSVLVSRRGETPTSHDVAFAVRDTGIGIAQGALSKLFQPFAQGDTSITRSFGGSGLGLVICKRLVELMGGRIGVQSEPGRGSLFWFRVPLLKVVGDLPMQRDLHGSRVLLVGSDETLLRRVQATLSDLHMKATQVANQSDARSALHAAADRGVHWRFNLVIVDAADSAAKAIAFAKDLMAEATLGELHVLVLTPPGESGVFDPAASRALAMPRTSNNPQLRSALDDLFGTAPQESAIPEPVVAHTAQSARRMHGHVLLVEDNTVNLLVARRLLQSHGLEVDSAGHGQEALNRIEATRYDLVLMDCQMPIMDGYTAARQRREAERANGWPRLPIIAMTAHAMAGDREKCLAAGMDDYLTKPLDRSRLERALARWLDAPSESAAQASPAPIQGDGIAAAANGVEESADVTEAIPVPAGDALDADVVREMLDVMGSDFVQLVRVYLEETPAKLAEIDRAADEADIPALIATTHTLKSSSANLGATALATLARSIEEDLRRSAQAAVGDRVAGLRPEYDRAASALRGLVDDGS